MTMTCSPSDFPCLHKTYFQVISFHLTGLDVQIVKLPYFTLPYFTLPYLTLPYQSYFHIVVGVAVVVDDDVESAKIR